MNFTYPIKQKKQIKKLMAVYPAESKKRLLLEFGLRTGLRISDILDLKVKDVHKQDFVWVQEKKTKKKKMLYLHPKLRQSIKVYVKSENLKPSDYLFFSEKNPKQAIQRMQAHRIISYAGDMIGVTPLSAHSLRKTFGYWSYKQGVDISLLQTIFQHSSQAVTLRYIGITQESINKVYATVDMGF
ncbi:tyrosine-type recombinase/integrase [Jeotgalibaca porci]|uniref:Tyrosine-type recombinase/integrase n=1 Tax=Jeotgalibaca porci TaxID=1868793 RepID=A0A6G7WEV7_9LACT|nr:tyrosine-type recombinase/integrase [Jeotgalibaca porci]QIK50747.1 tyrosine-type recombinase/integrase [Jeotgalibaca porci]